ncbi:SRPBCC family protein [Naasia lichenicola]|uniref:SRPBCC family protein n=1 Tax=Naasia lichenicola TaxID=2565933 RepID=A0A4S4FSL2_9MICO|nr:SRPBCC family protein [Naasia lichenicola]THG33394.1 SRPBCC family protein [Naasia lichenicola]
MTNPVRHIGISIDRAPSDVYDFAHDPANLPRWAAGLGGSIELLDGEWVAESPMGSVTVVMAPDNEFGVLDHTVTLPDGTRSLNPLRVLPNERGSEVVFSLFRLPGVDDAAYEADAAAIAADLATLKRLLE